MPLGLLSGPDFQATENSNVRNRRTIEHKTLFIKKTIRPLNSFRLHKSLLRIMTQRSASNLNMQGIAPIQAQRHDARTYDGKFAQGPSFLAAKCRNIGHIMHIPTYTYVFLQARCRSWIFYDFLIGVVAQTAALEVESRCVG